MLWFSLVIGQNASRRLATSSENLVTSAQFLVTLATSELQFRALVAILTCVSGCQGPGRRCGFLAISALDSESSVGLSIRSIIHSNCYHWACMMGPWSYWWTCLWFIQVTHKVTNLSQGWRFRLQMNQNFMTALKQSHASALAGVIVLWFWAPRCIRGYQGN